MALANGLRYPQNRFMMNVRAFFTVCQVKYSAIRWNQETEGVGFDMWGSKAPETYLSYGTEIVKATGAGAIA